MLRCLGSKDTIRQQMDFQEKYNVDEMMAVSYIYDPDKQKGRMKF